MTYNPLFSLYSFSSWSASLFIVCCCWLVYGIGRPFRLLFDYPSISLLIQLQWEYWRLQRKYIKLPIYLFNVSSSTAFSSPSSSLTEIPIGRTFMCFGRGKLYVWSFAKINFNECHIHWIVHCTFGIDWKHYNFIAFIFKPSERIGKKTKQDFRLPLLFFLLFVIAILLKSWSARIARSWSSRVKVDPK